MMTSFPTSTSSHRDWTSRCTRHWITLRSLSSSSRCQMCPRDELAANYRRRPSRMPLCCGRGSRMSGVNSSTVRTRSSFWRRRMQRRNASSWKSCFVSWNYNDASDCVAPQKLSHKITSIRNCFSLLSHYFII